MARRKESELREQKYDSSYYKERNGREPISPLPPRHVKHGRRRKRPPARSSPFVNIILLAFLSIVITLIVLSYWKING